MKKHTQSGFGLVPILLILILITAVGLTGYYVYKQQTPKQTDSTAAVAGESKTSPTPVVTSTPTPLSSPTLSPTSLSIPEFGLKLELSGSVYKDVKYAIIDDGKTAAIYSQQLFDKQVVAQKKVGMTIDENNTNQKYSCSRAVYAQYQKFTDMGLDGYEAITPNNRTKDSRLYIGGLGACDPGLADEYNAFKDWVKNNTKQQ